MHLLALVLHLVDAEEVDMSIRRLVLTAAAMAAIAVVLAALTPALAAMADAAGRRRSARSTRAGADALVLAGGRRCSPGLSGPGARSVSR